MTQDLNDLRIPNADGEPQALIDPSTSSADGQTHVYFRQLEDKLVDCIRNADVVVGCVAWLTNQRILRELATKSSVALVVQKEDFLRPDLDSPKAWKSRLRTQYDTLRCGFTRYDQALYGTVLHFMSSCIDPDIDPVRCVGNHNASKQPAFPRAHHKFLVFCRALPQESGQHEMDFPGFEPYAAWTGSFNLTLNATNSFENAVLLQDPSVVRSFFLEWAQLEALSEPLDWDSNWTAPEWRIGT